MATAKKSIKPVDLTKFSNEIRDNVLDISVDILDELTERIHDEAQRLAPAISSETHPSFETRRGPDKKGTLKDSIFWMESKNVPFSNLVVSPKWYSHFVEYGTEPHEIKAKNPKEKLLAFPKGGKVWTATAVNHPGIANPTPFLRPAQDKADTFIKQILQESGLKSK